MVRAIADELPVGIWVARAPGGEFIYANAAFAEIMGSEGRSDVAVGEYAAPYGIHTRSGELYPEDRMPFVRALAARATITVDDLVIHRSDGRRVNIRATARPIFDGSGEIASVVIAFIDITREVAAERTRAESEARLRTAQRMESIGNLAGGVAHDFNNLLMTIQLIASRLRLGERDPAHLDDLRLIDEVTQSAADLTRSLVGFTGRGKHRARPVSVNRVAQTIVELLRRTFDPRIEIALDLASSTGLTVGDFSQLEQVVMNLVVNARDAMPGFGRLTLRTRDQILDDEAACRHPPLSAGPHIVLEVCDTGAGIDPAIRDRIFEPYFTTKTSGSVRGTGLGLATVFGIIDGHRGAIEVLSREAKGTTMRLYFPAAPGAAAEPVNALNDPRFPARAKAARPTAVRGAGLILIVDDEPLVRSASARALTSIGYDTLLADDGLEAIRMFRDRRGEVAAVLLDLWMPNLDGRATYLELCEIDPDVAVLLTSGCPPNDESRALIDLGVREFIEKPCSVESLSEALARVIRRPAGSPPDPT